MFHSAIYINKKFLFLNYTPTYLSQPNPYTHIPSKLQTITFAARTDRTCATGSRSLSLSRTLCRALRVGAAALITLSFLDAPPRHMRSRYMVHTVYLLTRRDAKVQTRQNGRAKADGGFREREQRCCARDCLYTVNFLAQCYCK